MVEAWIGSEVFGERSELTFWSGVEESSAIGIFDPVGLSDDFHHLSFEPINLAESDLMDLISRDSDHGRVVRELGVVSLDAVYTLTRADARSARWDVLVLEKQREFHKHWNDPLLDDRSRFHRDRILHIQRSQRLKERRQARIVSDLRAALRQHLLDGRTKNHLRRDAPRLHPGSHVVHVIPDQDIDLAQTLDIHGAMLLCPHRETRSHLREPDLRP